MDDASPTLLLTRPDPQSRAFLADCEAAIGRRISAVVAPLMQIVDVGDVPDLTDFRTVIVTSSHAVRRLGEAGFLRGQLVACVGETTALLARKYGADAIAFGLDVDGLLARASELVGPCLYVRGRHIRLDLVTALRTRGVQVEEAVVYDQVAQPLSRAGEALLSGTEEVVVPLFSARSAELLSRSLDIRAPITVIAMSNAVAAAWTGGGTLCVVAEPTSAAMCAAVAQVI